jgi:tight adherence protein B
MLAALLVFILGAGAVLGAYLAITQLPGYLERRKLEKRLQSLAAGKDIGNVDDTSLVMRPNEGPLPAIDRIMSKLAAGTWLQKLIDQSGIQTTPSAIVVMAALLGLLLFVTAHLFLGVLMVSVMVAVAGGFLPFAFLLHRRSSRLHNFEEQFPEALDLLSRALRAGHAFQTAMGMVAEEVKDPVGPEFKKTFDQQNFGLPLKDALLQMPERVPILDVRFFVTAVLIQRETGGNLSEILDNLAHVVRERFKIRRQVRVHTAHGRFTAFVLLALPAGLGIILQMLNPEHMKPLFTEPLGRMMLGITIVMMIVGFVWIRKIIRIEV